MAVTSADPTLGRELRVVATEQVVGHVVGLPDGTVEYREAADGMWRPLRARVGDDKAGALLLEEGWSNGYLYLTSLRPAEDQALTAARRRRFGDGDNFEEYWTAGPGLARWATNPHPFTTLVALLRKHPKVAAKPGFAERLAATYFKKVHGIWPSERRRKRAIVSADPAHYPADTPGGKGGQFMPKGGVVGAPDDDGTGIFRRKLRIRGVDVEVTAHADGSRTLDFGGGRSIRLAGGELEGARNERNNLASMAFQFVDSEVGATDVVTRITDGDRPRQELLVGLKKVAQAPDVEGEETWQDDILSLHLPPNEDPSYDELLDSEPVATMRARDVATLAEQARTLLAERIETGNGRLDVYRDGGRYVLRSEGDEEIRLDRRSARGLYDTLNDLWDEEGEPREPTETEERTVTTNVGDVTVRMTGDGGRTEIVTPSGSIVLAAREHLSEMMRTLVEWFE